MMKALMTARGSAYGHPCAELGRMCALLCGSAQIGELSDDPSTQLVMAGGEGRVGAVGLLRGVEPDGAADAIEWLQLIAREQEV
jgi:hypothetical protein